jgi:hypothetical protein
VLTPSVGTSNTAAIATLWTGQALTGIGAAVLFPTSPAMVAAGTHTALDRARGIAIWSAALSSGESIHSYNPRWALGAGFLLIAAGDFWIATQSPADRSLCPIVAPLVVVGVGFALALSGVTAIAVNTVPNHLAGTASGTTSQLRDFGFTLGPVVIGAIALSMAASEIQDKLRASSALQAAMERFSAGAPPEAVGAVNYGPLGANAVAGDPIHNVAFHALDHAYAIGYVVCGVSALVAAVLAAARTLGGAAHRPLITEESLHD